MFFSRSRSRTFSRFDEVAVLEFCWIFQLNFVQNRNDGPEFRFARPVRPPEGPHF